jgi:hypothetical protein
MMECYWLEPPNSEICLACPFLQNLYDMDNFSGHGYHIIWFPYQNTSIAPVFRERGKHKALDGDIGDEMTRRCCVDLGALKGETQLCWEYMRRLGRCHHLSFILVLNKCCQNLNIRLETITQLGLDKFAKDRVAVLYGIRTPSFQ